MKYLRDTTFENNIKTNINCTPDEFFTNDFIKLIMKEIYKEKSKRVIIVIEEDE